MSNGISTHKDVIINTAAASIKYGLQHQCSPPLVLDSYPEDLRQHGAAFVTLKKHDQLRGCIGTLEAHRPLIFDISENAYAAAFRDPRFQPVIEPELSTIHISVSILTPPIPIEPCSEQALLTLLRPGQDGLIIEEGIHRATFLPSVWEALPSPTDFVGALKQKAGFDQNYWSDNIKLFRYQTICIEPSNQN